MEQTNRVLYHPTKFPLTPKLKRAIIEWPNGLEGPPQIFPLADSLEEAESVGKFLEKRLGNES